LRRARQKGISGLRWVLAAPCSRGLEVTGRFLDLETARVQVGVAERALVAAKENVQVLSDRYREGVSPSFELLDAETQALTAGLDLTLANTQLRVAMARLDRAVGR
jgi:outer membrane protein TolC